MSKGRQTPAKGQIAAKRAAAGKGVAASKGARTGEVLDLDRYVPALITFIANKLSRSATTLYQKRFGVNVTEWRILALLAIEPIISAARICHVIGFDKGPVSRNLAVMEERGLVTIKADPRDGRTHAISMTPKGWATHDGRHCGGARTRTPPALLSAEGRAGNSDRIVAAASTAISMP